MGNCQPNYTPSSSTFIPTFQTLNQIFCCPNGHSLAFFESSVCLSCRNNSSKAIINCITCSYSLCLSCFDRRLSALRKNQLSDGKRFKKMMNKLKLERELKKWTEAKRLQEFILSKTERDRHIRVESVPISLEESVKVRTNMVVEYGLTKTITL